MGIAAFRSDRLNDFAARLPRIVELLLIILLVLLLVDLFWPEQKSSTVADVENQAAAAGENSRVEVPIQQIIDAKLFGEAKALPAPKKAVAVKSSRNIKVLGTIMAGERSAAMLQVRPGARQEMFKVGQPVMPGVVLKSVEKSRVILESGGRLESIELVGWNKAGLPH